MKTIGLYVKMNELVAAAIHDLLNQVADDTREHKIRCLAK